VAQRWKTVAKGNRRFALALYQELAASGTGNICFSPFGIALGLALVHAGAGGETRREMDKALGFPAGGQSVHELLSALVAELAGRSEPDSHWKAQRAMFPGVDFGFHLTLASGLWHQSGRLCRKAYLDILRDRYSVAPVEVDFEHAAAEACAVINEWVDRNTGGRIDRIVSADQFDALTRLIFANAIYFKADWAHQFPMEATAESPFHLLDGSQILVPMMGQQDFFPYWETDAAQVVGLPYVKRELSFVVLLPRTGRFGEFEQNLDAQCLEDALFGDESESTYLRLTMPRFRIAWRSELRPGLQNLGLRRLFEPGFDLSAISGDSDLGVSDMLHACCVAVDEKGTEAAAVTTGGVAMGFPPEPVEVRLDRPFLFFIVDRPTRIVLFAGRVTRPA
jgi:serpin B